MKHLAWSLLLAAACVAKTSAPPTAPSPPPASAGSASAPPAGAPDCVCTMDYNPVCGADGKTYSNACQAGCAKVAVKSSGACAH